MRTLAPRDEKDQLLIFLLQLCLGDKNLLSDAHILEDHLHQTNMIDGIFQPDCGENLEGLGNTAKKSEVEGSIFLLSPSLGDLGCNKLNRRSFRSKLLFPPVSLDVFFLQDQEGAQ